MPLRYRTDAYTLHVQVVRQLVPGIKVSGLTCQQCADRRQMLFVHPDNPDLWLCHKCMHFDRSSHGSYQLSAIARAQSALETAATAFLDPQPHTKRQRDHEEIQRPEQPTVGKHGRKTLTALSAKSPQPTSPGMPITTPLSTSTATTTPLPISTPPICPPIASKVTKSRRKRHKSL